MSLDLFPQTERRVGVPGRITFRSRLVAAWHFTSGSLAARRLLARTLRPPRTRGSPEIPPHLLRDIGLPEDYRQGWPRRWDHQ